VIQDPRRKTYGAASAIISVLALVGIVLTLSYQAREAKLAREETRRQAVPPGRVSTTMPSTTHNLSVRERLFGSGLFRLGLVDPLCWRRSTGSRITCRRPISHQASRPTAP
jgi:hypothetical protein